MAKWQSFGIFWVQTISLFVRMSPAVAKRRSTSVDTDVVATQVGMYRAWARPRIQFVNTRESSSSKWKCWNFFNHKQEPGKNSRSTFLDLPCHFKTWDCQHWEQVLVHFWSWSQTPGSPWSLLRINTTVFRTVRLLDSSTWKSSYSKYSSSKIPSLDASLQMGQNTGANVSWR